MDLPAKLLGGAIDKHVHAGPQLVGSPPRVDPFEAASEARDAGRRALVFMDVFEMSIGTAWLVDRQVPGFRTYGGLHPHHADSEGASSRRAAAAVAAACVVPVAGWARRGEYQRYVPGRTISALSEATPEGVTPAPMADLLDVLAESFVLPERRLADVAVLPLGNRQPVHGDAARLRSGARAVPERPGWCLLAPARGWCGGVAAR